MKKLFISIISVISIFSNLHANAADEITVSETVIVGNINENNDNLALVAHNYNIPDGGTLISQSDLLQHYRNRNHSNGTFRMIGVVGVQDNKAVEVDITSEPNQPWDTQLIGKIDSPLKKGDTLFVTFLARTISAQDETGEGKLTVFAQLNRAPHTKFLYNTVTLGDKWTRIHYPFKADRDYAAGTAAVGLFLGYRIQKIQIADMKLYNYGQNRKLSEFPITKVTYRGQATAAPWRKEAAERIDKYRKADLKVIIKDSSGKPVKNAEVLINQNRHAFHFGSAISARLLMQQDADGEKYRKVIEECFTMVVFENDLKWPRFEDKQNREITLQAVNWLKDHNIAIRGHCLIWPSWKHTPRDLKGLKDNPDALVKRINDHITEETTLLKGSIYEWDVINEPYSNYDVMKVLGNEAMISWFKLAHECDPDAGLLLNDYSILSGGGSDYKHQGHFEQTLKFLIDGGAPISGIGMQSHFGTNLTPPDKVYKILDRYSALKLPISITEHDINTIDLELQADYTRDFMTITFSHPNVSCFLSWGFWAGRHWRPNAAYFDKEWILTPAGKVWINMFKNTWRTEEKLSTDNEGITQTRAFLGDYTITVTHDEKSVKKDVKVTKAGSLVIVKM